MDDGGISVALDGEVAVVSLSSADGKNALDRAMLDRIGPAMREADELDGANVILVRSAGHALLRRWRRSDVRRGGRALRRPAPRDRHVGEPRRADAAREREDHGLRGARRGGRRRDRLHGRVRHRVRVDDRDVLARLLDDRDVARRGLELVPRARHRLPPRARAVPDVRALRCDSRGRARDRQSRGRRRRRSMRRARVRPHGRARSAAGAAQRQAAPAPGIARAARRTPGRRDRDVRRERTARGLRRGHPGVPGTSHAVVRCLPASIGHGRDRSHRTRPTRATSSRAATP